MKAKTIKIIGAVAAVAIVVVAASVFLLGGDDKNVAYSKDAQLLIFGNADGDRDIDEDDIKVIRDILKTAPEGEKISADNYVWADADQDTYITEDDVAMVRSMIDGTAKKVYYLNVDDEVREYKVVDKVNIITFHRTTARAATLLSEVSGDNTQLVGMDNTMNESEFAYIKNQTSPAVANVGSLKSPNTEAVSKLQKEYGNVVILAGSQESYVSQFETTFKDDDGVQIVRLPTWEGDYAVNGVLTLGYLFAGITGEDGENAWTKALEYCKWHDKYRGMINDSVKGMSDKPTIIAMYSVESGSSDVVLGPGSGDCEYSEIAGGKNLYSLFGNITRNNWTLETLAAAESREHIDVIVTLCGKTYGGDSTFVDSFAQSAADKFNGYVSPDTRIYAASWDFSGVGYLMTIVFYATALYPDDPVIGAIDMEEVFDEYLDLMGGDYASGKDYSDLSLWSDAKHTTQPL